MPHSLKLCRVRDGHRLQPVRQLAGQRLVPVPPLGGCHHGGGGQRSRGVGAALLIEDGRPRRADLPQRRLGVHQAATQRVILQPQGRQLRLQRRRGGRLRGGMCSRRLRRPALTLRLLRRPGAPHGVQLAGELLSHLQRVMQQGLRLSSSTLGHRDCRLVLRRRTLGLIPLLRHRLRVSLGDQQRRPGGGRLTARLGSHLKGIVHVRAQRRRRACRRRRRRHLGLAPQLRRLRLQLGDVGQLRGALLSGFLQLGQQRGRLIGGGRHTCRVAVLHGRELRSKVVVLAAHLLERGHRVRQSAWRQRRAAR